MDSRQPAKHKELLNDIFKVQEKLEELSCDELLKDEAFRQLSKINKELYEKINNVLKGLDGVKYLFNQRVYNSRWTQQYDPSYHRRQVKSRQHKLLNQSKYKKCKCGELISHDHFSKHLKTDKHVASILRIDIENNEKKRNNILKPSNLDLLLVVNSQINYYINGTKNHLYIGNVKKLGMTRMEWLTMFIRRIKIKNK